MTSLSKSIYYLIAGISGASVLIVEIGSTRLLTPYFGASIFVWTSAISVILAALAIGYFWGAQKAKKEDVKIELIKALVFASLATWLIPFAIKYLGSQFPVFFQGDIPNIAVVLFMYIAALVTLLPAGIFYGLVSPLIIEVLGRNGEHPGSTAGRVYAVSTVGSIVGSVLTPIVFYPSIGSHALFIATSVLMMSLVLIILENNRLRYIFLLLAIILLAMGLNFKPNLENSKIVYAKETPYQVIRVFESETQFDVIYNEGLGVQSVYPKNGPWTGRYWDWMAMTPMISTKFPQSATVIGFAGGAVPRIWDEVDAFDQMSVTGVDIDPASFELVKELFSDNLYGVTPVSMDGRQFLAQNKTKTDLLLVDAFANELEIPFHLTSKEFFDLTTQRLNDGGVLAMNLAIGARKELGDRLYQTIKSSYKHVYELVDDDVSGNALVIASQDPIDFERFKQAFISTGAPVSPHFQIGEITSTDAQIFTDDLAPIELLTVQSIFK
jgi:spermidine synthase